jgi:hypothetical protein
LIKVLHEVAEVEVEVPSKFCSNHSSLMRPKYSRAGLPDRIYTLYLFTKFLICEARHTEVPRIYSVQFLTLIIDAVATSIISGHRREQDDY